MSPLVALSLLALLAAALWAVVLVARVRDWTARFIAALLVAVSAGHFAAIARTLETWTPEPGFRLQELPTLGITLAVLLTVALFQRILRRHRQVQVQYGIERAYLTELFENSPEAIVLVDNDGSVLRVNGPFTELFGYAPKEILGKAIDDLLPPADQHAEALDITRRISRGERVTMEAARRRKDGRLVEVAIIGAPVKVGSGRVAVFGIYRDITERKQIEQELRRLQKAVETTQLGVTVTDVEGKITYVNPAEADMHGWKVEELHGKDVRTFAAESAAMPMSAPQLQAVTSWRRESVNVRKNGSVFPVQLMSDVVRDADGTILGIVTTCEDITRRKEAEAALRTSEERYALAARGSNDGLWDWEVPAGLVYYSDRWWSMLGYDKAEVGSDIEAWLGRVHSEDSERVRGDLDAHLNGAMEQFESEHRLRHKDGTYRWILVRGLVVRNDEGRPLRMAGSLTDISARKRIEESLARDALYDPLTSLPNRGFFTNLLERSARRVQRRGDYHFAVLFLDLDRFKVVNDSLGHDTGDRLLKGVAQRLERCLRPGDVVARLAGDEFCILVDGIENIGDATRVAERVQEELRAPFVLNGHRVFATASIGIATSTTGNARPENLLRDADTAMYRAKSSGRGRIEVFDAKMHERAMYVLQVESDLRTALEENRFRLVYLPVVSLETRRIMGFEALLRWDHPERGTVSPAEFVPVAEETGVIVALGLWVLRTACRQFTSWLERHPLDDSFSISVNLSSKQLQQVDFVEQLEAILRETRMSPSRLKLEVTETVLMNDPDFSTEVVRRLDKLGVQIQIDDFGTGYSSLSYLNRLRVDTLKIDRSFIKSLGEPGERATIVQAIIRLARDLGIHVIAEGVETSEQLDSLRTLECEHGQGFLFSQPVDGERALTLLSTQAD
ncbi:MAG: EAL domain-containing protein [Gemmatimonadota bacterium]|nr:EAL domain-containing protein [Gemmatimonadota bacterium]MDH3478241.1 EAL domain-containing protein [Gemmatimonadota bacterium]